MNDTSVPDGAPEKPLRRQLMRPVQLIGFALVCGVFAAVVTLVTTGAFTADVNAAIARGTYEGLPPIALGFVVGGIAFIATLLMLAMLMLAVDPAEITRPVDRPVLYDAETEGEADAPSSGPAVS